MYSIRNVPERVKKQVAGRQLSQCNNKPHYPAIGCEEYLCPLWLKSINPGNFDQASYEVDHIIELRGGGSNDPSNLQALCPNCHSYKTRNFNKKFIRKEVIEEMDVEDSEINLEITKSRKDISLFVNKHLLRSQKSMIGWVILKKKFIKWCGENKITKYKHIPNNKLKNIFIELLFKVESKKIKTNEGLREGWTGYCFK